MAMISTKNRKQNNTFIAKNYLLFSLFFFINLAVAQSTIDVHSHIILPEYMEVLKKNHAEFEEKFPLPQWDATLHIKFMEEAGIDYSILTMPSPQPYFGDTQESQRIIRTINEVSATLKISYPGKFKFCASLPLPDVNASIKEAIYALDTLHADCIKLASNSRGQYIGDVELDPLMDVLNERNAVLIIHPNRPTPYSDQIITTTPLAMYEYPAETTRGIVNMISRNVLVHYPNVKVVVPHAGSFLPMALPRMKSIHPIMVAKEMMGSIDWETNMSKLYYDLAGNPTPDIIKMLLTITTPDHIMYGSDFPYQPTSVLLKNKNMLQENIQNDKALAPYLQMFLSENARHLFKK